MRASLWRNCQRDGGLRGIRRNIWLPDPPAGVYPGLGARTRMHRLTRKRDPGLAGSRFHLGNVPTGKGARCLDAVLASPDAFPNRRVQIARPVPPGPKGRHLAVEPLVPLPFPASRPSATPVLVGVPCIGPEALQSVAADPRTLAVQSGRKSLSAPPVALGRRLEPRALSENRCGRNTFAPDAAPGKRGAVQHGNFLCMERWASLCARAWRNGFVKPAQDVAGAVEKRSRQPRFSAPAKGFSGVGAEIRVESPRLTCLKARPCGPGHPLLCALGRARRAAQRGPGRTT